MLSHVNGMTLRHERNHGVRIRGTRASRLIRCLNVALVGNPHGLPNGSELTEDFLREKPREGASAMSVGVQRRFRF
jgi:hypothetical protein